MKSSSQNKLLLLLLSLPLLAGCISTPPVVKPIKALYYNYSETDRADTLIVLLHGKGGSERDFEKHGFIEEVKSRGLAVDIVAVNSHLGYYFNRSITRRLKKDVINPAKIKGYKNVWLVGISMGGLGSLLYAMEQPEDIDGIFLMAPFLGNSGVVQRIKKSGGLKTWDPGSASIEKWQKDLFTYIRKFSDPKGKMPLLYLAYGTDDGYRPASLLLEEILPEERVFKREGRHNWKTWQPLWVKFIEKGPFLKAGKD